MNAQITRYLLRRGLKPNYKGFDYLVAVLAITSTSEERLPITVVYRIVAEQKGVTPQSVERCIRLLTDSYWRSTQKPMSQKPTNSEFIYDCSVRIRLNIIPNDDQAG